MLKNTLFGLGLLLVNIFSPIVSAQETIDSTTVTSTEVESFVAELGLTDTLSNQLYGSLKAEGLIVNGEGMVAPTSHSKAAQTPIEKALLTTACSISKFKFGEKYFTSDTSSYRAFVEINWYIP